MSRESPPPVERREDHPLRVAAAYSWRLLVIVAAGYVVLHVTVTLRIVVLPVLAALFITALLHPLMERLRGRGWKPLPAAWVVLLSAVIVLGGLGAAVAYPTSRELDEVTTSVREGSEQVLTWLTEGPLDLTERQVQQFIDDVSRQLGENRQELASGIISGAVVVGEIIAGLLLTIVLTFFFLKDGPLIVGWLERLIPRRNRDHARELAGRAWATMGAYLRGVAIVAFVDAALIAILLLVLGVPLVVPLALLTFIGGFFPLVGATLAGVVATLVALVTQGVLDAVIVGLGILAIQQIEGDVLQPVIMGRAVSLHPVAILLALATGAVLAGVVGAFLSVPVAATAATAGGYLRSVWSGEDGVSVIPD